MFATVAFNIASKADCVATVIGDTTSRIPDNAANATAAAVTPPPAPEAKAIVLATRDNVNASEAFTAEPIAALAEKIAALTAGTLGVTEKEQRAVATVTPVAASSTLTTIETRPSALTGGARNVQFASRDGTANIGTAASELVATSKR